MLGIHWYRIWAIVMRHLYLQFKDMLRLFDIFYWPILSIMEWGFTSLWFQRHESDPNLITIMLVGVILWEVVYRANLEISVNLLEEMWDQNLVNLFSTPLHFSEWVMGMMLLGAMRVLMMVMMCFVVIWLLYHFNVMSLGFMLVPFLLLQACSGWFMGFLTAALMVRFGKQSRTLPWPLGWLWAPFCGIFYPLEVLPWWMQKVGAMLPMTYVFEAARKFVATGKVPTESLMISASLNAFYFVVVLVFFRYMFQQSRVRGLARLE